MADYFVRKSGSDSNGGTDPDTDAWLTIDKAASTVTTGGNDIWIGAGVYREAVVVDYAGSTGSPIRFLADLDGSMTGDAGKVIITAHNSESAAPTRTTCWDPNVKGFVEVHGITMVGGTLGAVYKSGANNYSYDECVFENCTFLDGPESTDHSIVLGLGSGGTAPTTGMRWNNCVFSGSVWFLHNGNETADVDIDCEFNNCIWIGRSNSTNGNFYWDVVTTGTYQAGGITLNGCTFTGYNGVLVDDGAGDSGVPVTVRNSYFVGCQNGMYKYTSNDGALVDGGYNSFIGVVQPLYLVTAGTGTRQNTYGRDLIGGWHDLDLIRQFGWSPFKPFEPIRTLSDAYTASLIGDADTSTANATDFYDRQRPMYGTVDDRGAVEGRARPEQETTTVRTGSNAVVFNGAGEHVFDIPVGAQSTTISIYGRYDATYSGSLPDILVYNIPGVADQSDVQTGGSGAWEELTATFTPTSAGVVQLRIRSRDTSAAGKCFFDDLTVT